MNGFPACAGGTHSPEKPLDKPRGLLTLKSGRTSTMTLAVIAKLCGRETSLQIASRAEYEWHEDSSWDPFAAAAGL